VCTLILEYVLANAAVARSFAPYFGQLIGKTSEFFVFAVSGAAQHRQHVEIFAGAAGGASRARGQAGEGRKTGLPTQPRRAARSVRAALLLLHQWLRGLAAASNGITHPPTIFGLRAASLLRAPQTA
jgi:hypothetical protein